jgi:hypothetical protein
MYCPNCGNQNSADQKFCRSCGLGLQKVAASINEQLPTKLDLSLQQKKEKFEKLGVAALSIFGAGVAIPFLYGVFYKLMWTQGRITAGLGTLALVLVLASGLISVILFAKANEMKEKPADRPLPREVANDTAELMPESVPQTPIFSVAERTTELLSDPKPVKR